MTRIIPATWPDGIEEAVEALRGGQLVAIPTETVYGLAADAANGTAVAGIFAAKNRPSFNPLIVHVASAEMAEEYGVFDDLARRLTAAFWPGPLTIVLPLRENAGLHPLVSAGLPTLALRMPRGAMREIIARLGRPIAAPSANRSGKVSPTSAAHVMHSLGERVDLIIDGGPAAIGVESTIVRPAGGRIFLLRPGGVADAAVTEATGLSLEHPSADRGIEAPGQLRSHYAPHGRVRLNVRDVSPGEWLVRFGDDDVAGEENAGGVRQLSRGKDLSEAAANLFAVLFDLDELHVERIAVMPIPPEGIGAAINDRLRRAAAPRETTNRDVEKTAE